mmetsp:Transcript_19053/g.62500  ORF Transcript_19053/g.62500 Transcript_19053/m.62500 type:complete len:212 (+) Transcript_19053:164-799(+)
MRMESTVPSWGATMVDSIFMALRTKRVSPFLTTSPSLTLTATTTPGMGAPTEPRSPGLALGRTTTSADADVSTRVTDRGKPLTSKKHSRVPFFSSRSPMPVSLTLTVTPWPKLSSSSSPTSSGSTNARVGRFDRSPNSRVVAMKSSKTWGYMTADMSCRSSTATPCFSSSSARTFSKSTAGSCAPGRPAKVSSVLPAPASTCVRSGSGKPP